MPVWTRKADFSFLCGAAALAEHTNCYKVNGYGLCAVWRLLVVAVQQHFVHGQVGVLNIDWKFAPKREEKIMPVKVSPARVRCTMGFIHDVSVFLFLQFTVLRI